MNEARKSSDTVVPNVSEVSATGSQPTVAGIIEEFRRFRKGDGLSRDDLEKCPNLLGLQQVRDEADSSASGNLVLAADKVLSLEIEIWSDEKQRTLIGRAINLGRHKLLNTTINGRRMRSVDDGYGSMTTVRADENKALKMFAYELFSKHVQLQQEGARAAGELDLLAAGLLTLERIDVDYVFSDSHVPDYWLERRRIRCEVDALPSVLTKHLYTGASGGVSVSAVSGCLISDELRRFVSSAGYDYQEVLFIDENGEPLTLRRGQTHEYAIMRRITDRSVPPQPFAALNPEYPAQVGKLRVLLGANSIIDPERTIGPSIMLPSADEIQAIGVSDRMIVEEFKNMIPGYAYGVRWRWLTVLEARRIIW